jgi:hypothetical protein
MGCLQLQVHCVLQARVQPDSYEPFHFSSFF